jgi:hypothetical protein
MFLAQESLARDMLVGVLFGLVQDLHRDGEGGQTHRMGNNTSLLELSLPLNNWANPCCKIGGKFGL